MGNKANKKTGNFWEVIKYDISSFTGLTLKLITIASHDLEKMVTN